MAWITVPGLAGKIYAPDDEKAQKKHLCNGCFSCQWCDETRCRVCRGQNAAGRHTASCRCKYPPRPSAGIDAP